MNIEISKLCKTYGNTDALKDMNLSIDKPALIGLIGKNGAGKTTLMKMIAGRIKPTKGNILVDGKNPFDNLENDFVYIDEEMKFDDSLKLKDILRLMELYYPKFEKKRAKQLISYFELDEKKRYRNLSRGMKSQFNILFGLTAGTRMILFDEPTLGLDAAFRRTFYEILLKDYIRKPRLILISSHMVAEIEKILEYVIIIDKGNLIFNDTKEKIISKYYYSTSNKEILDQTFNENEIILKNEGLGSWRYLVNVKKDSENIEYSNVSLEDIFIAITNDEKELEEILQ